MPFEKLGFVRKGSAAWFAAAALLLCLLTVQLLFGQREDWELEQLCQDLAAHRQPPPTEFVFARIQFTSHAPGRGFWRRPTPCGPLEGWAHDYPAAEQNILQLTREATRINLNKDSYAMVRLDSDELFRYPWGLMSEVGEMTLTDREVANLRTYLDRGGFIVADDFDGPNLEWFQQQMNRVFPGRQFVPLTVDNPIFHTLYEVKTLEMEPPYPQRGFPRFYGYYDDHGRLSMILDDNNDLGDFWEWIDDVRYPLVPSAEGLRFGINYFLYSLTH